MGEIADLYRLQQLELNIDSVRRELKGLPVYGQFKKLQNEVADNREAVSRAESKLAEQRKRSRRLEMEVERIHQESKAVQARLYSGTVKSAKELEQMENKNKALLREKSKTEEDLLLAMEAVEELEKTLAEARGNLEINSHRLSDMQRQGNREIKNYKDRIAELQAEIDGLRSRVSPSLLAEYDAMRTRFHGRPVARLEGENCSGCRVSISSNLRNRLCNPSALVHCENCGRLLVPQGS